MTVSDKSFSKNTSAIAAGAVANGDIDPLAGKVDQLHADAET